MQKSKQEPLGPSVDWLPASVWPPPRGKPQGCGWLRKSKQGCKCLGGHLLGRTCTCTNHSCCLGLNHTRDCNSFIVVYIYTIHVMQQTQPNLDTVKNLCMFVCSVSLFPDMSCLLLSKQDWDVVLAAAVLLPWLFFWVRMLYDPSNPLHAPPSSCFVSFHLVSFFFFFLLLSPMFSFGMTQLDVFKLKWKKKGFGVSPPAGQRKLPLKWGPPGLGILHTDSASSSDTSTCCVCCRSRTWLSKHVLSLSSVRVRRSSRTATVWEKRTNS